MAIKIDITRAVEEFDIAGNIYTMGMSDDDLARYRKEYAAFEHKAADLEKLDENDPNADEKARQLIKDIYDVLLGPGAFERIYHDVGKSSYVMVSALKQIMDTIDLKYRETNQNQQQAQQQRYVRKPQHRNNRR